MLCAEIIPNFATSGPKIRFKLLMGKLAPIFFAFLFSFQAYAEHLIGGDIGYTCLGANRFGIKLTIYRDCLNSQTPLDNPAYITIINNDNFSFTSIVVPLTTAQNIPLNDLGPCIQTPPTVCIQRGTYEQVITLTPNTNGYQVIYQRCCRNNIIQNLSSPGFQGSTYAITIPPQAFNPCNNSPAFKQNPPPALCVNELFNFDFSATDLDGDSLTYFLCAPFSGANQSNPAPTIASAPPYSPVLYIPGYSPTIPFGSGGTISIHPSSGLMLAQPTREGQYVIGVCVSEFRNGTLLSTTSRDFQFNVANCNVARAQVGFTELLNCRDSTITFVNQSTGNFTNNWEFYTDTDTFRSTANSPVFSFPDTGIYQIKLTINRGQPCADSTFALVKIFPSPKASFTANAACQADEVVNFTNTSTSPLNNIASYTWNLGNGQTSAATNPQTVYNSSGNIQVSLIAVTENGCRDTARSTVTIYPKPTANFSPVTACEDVPVSFVNTSQSVVPIASSGWTFQGTSTLFSVELDPVIIYNNQGTFNVQLITADQNGCRDTISKSVEVFPPISAAFLADKIGICEGETITFSNQSQGSIDQYIWLFGDGTQSNSNDASKTYSNDGNYTVQLIAINNTCGSDTAEAIISVRAVPEANIGGRQLSICAGETAIIGLDNNVSYDSIVWSTGDLTREITITEPGIYTATVYTNDCSNTASIEVNTFCLVFMPTAFSPNNDGRNDRFNIIDKNVDSYVLSIYNRWNEQIFTTNSLGVGWDGTYKGVPSLVDVYIYHVSGIKSDGVPFEQKGIFNLLR
jgi:gliding motility-associated-like protein